MEYSSVQPPRAFHFLIRASSLILSARVGTHISTAEYYSQVPNTDQLGRGNRSDCILPLTRLTSLSRCSGLSEIVLRVSARHGSALWTRLRKVGVRNRSTDFLPKLVVSRNGLQMRTSFFGIRITYGHHRLNNFLHSCERCRRLKIKCSGQQPCEGCDKRKLACNFDDRFQKVLVTRG